jgi:ribulose 1,5-bisphosphate carboxylase large subunit-like protein
MIHNIMVLIVLLIAAGLLRFFIYSTSVVSSRFDIPSLAVKAFQLSIAGMDVAEAVKAVADEATTATDTPVTSQERQQLTRLITHKVIQLRK